MLYNTKHKTVSTPSSQTLHVIAVVSNPVGYKSRYKHFEQFHRHMMGFNVELTTVDLAFGEREHVAPLGHNHLQIHTWDEVWHKENMINLAMSRLPPDWQYVAWIDGDIAFTNPHWVQQTINQLQHHMVVQLFQDAIDLGPNGETIQTHSGFGYNYATGKPPVLNNGDYYGVKAGGVFWHPGFAWAARREAINHMGGLIDWAVLGSADHHMALAMIGQADRSLPKGVAPSYRRRLKSFEAACERYVRRDIGYVPGTIVHYWHGKKKDRKYQSRWDIVTQYKFNPDTDLKKDWQGVIQLVDHGDARSIGLREAIRSYHRQRSEDSIDLE